jgi:hypothetical protein
MPDAAKTAYENVPGAPSPEEANVLNKIIKVGFTCTNCGQKFTHRRLPAGDETQGDPDSAPR